MLAFAFLPALASTPPRLDRSSPQATPAGNGRIAFVSQRFGDTEIFAMDPDGGTQIDLSNDPGPADTQPSWSPDGTKIAFMSDRTGDAEIWVMNADGSGQVDLTQDPGTSESEPSWSPDGTRIAYTSTTSPGQTVWVMNADGSGQTDISTHPNSSDYQAAWSPDGTSIAFTSDRNGDPEIWEMGPDGSGQTNISNDPGFADSEPRWSPDGTRIVFVSDRAGSTDVWLMDPSGSNQVQLTSNAGELDGDPSFSPDQGTRVLFTQLTGSKDQVWVVNVRPDGTTYSTAVPLTLDARGASLAAWQPLPALPSAVTPIQHVVVLFMENHSFDNVLGLLCVQDVRCDGATSGLLHDGTVYQLTQATDVVAGVAHAPGQQRIAVDGGAMDGWDRIGGCHLSGNYVCYSQYSPDQIPNLAALARAFVISDRTFENNYDETWVAHNQLVTATRDGFQGTNPPVIGQHGPGWGCDSLLSALWRPSRSTQANYVPSCIPQPDGSGPFQPSPVAWVATIMDRMDGAGLSWKLYGNEAYGRVICPAFADCLYTSQAQDVVSASDFATDASAGTLPDLALVMPPTDSSQHNAQSMLKGDDWIGSEVSDVMNGPEWGSTAIFITYDDCGCFYDHVPPPFGEGVRVPTVIVSPYAVPGFTDSTLASYGSILAFTEHVFGLAPMSSQDASAYDYSKSFDYSQPPRRPIQLPGWHPIPRWEQRYLRSHPADPDDPT